MKDYKKKLRREKEAMGKVKEDLKKVILSRCAGYKINVLQKVK